MVILQKWEPTISATFPSKIPFWIELQGLPKHFWKHEMLKTIGDELGEMMDSDISPSAAKIRVLVDGLQPLTKETIVEFPDGNEAVVYLEYKNLKNHCQHCLRLTHERKNCPGILDARDISSPLASRSSPAERSISRNYYTPEDNFVAPRTASLVSGKSYGSHRGQPTHKRLHGQAKERDHSPHNNRSSSNYGYAVRRASRSPERGQRTHDRAAIKLSSLRRNHAFSHPNQSLHEREKTPSVGHQQDSSETSRSRRPPLERNLNDFDQPTPLSPHQNSSCRRSINPTEVFSPPAIIPTKEQVMGELREVTIQYTACADPTESAARKHRVIQGETRNLMASTVDSIIAAAAASAPLPLVEGDPIPVDYLTSQASLQENPPLPEKTSGPPVKRGRGRPPTPKQSRRHLLN